MSANRAEKATPADRLKALKSEMARVGVDGFIVPLADEYQGEYPPASARRMEWLTGFTGSAGAAAVLADGALENPNEKSAAVFADGRYTVQAKQQVDASLYDQQNFAGFQSVKDWAAGKLKAGSKMGYDPWMHTQSAVEAMKKDFAKKGIELVAVPHNLVDAVWKDRPPVPREPVKVYDEKYAGESSASKRERLAKSVRDNGADAAIVAAPDSIAWLLNIRGGDVKHTPLALSFAVLHGDGKVDWFIDPAKVSDAVRQHVGKDVTIRPMEVMEATLQGLNGKQVQYDAKRSSAWFHDTLTAAGAGIVNQDDPCLLPKACKNATEVEGMRQAHIRDGVALSKLLCWLDEEAPKRPVSELDVEEKLLGFRKEQAEFQEPSFDTIAGSGEHGAIVHYRATEKSNKVLGKDTMFLLDSGGQYLDGTTDVTRTVVVGEPTDEQKRRFTQVLKGHINLGSAVFPKGISGKDLDVLARNALWQDGEDYAHGTGHGVGAYLGVHEGPQGISSRNDVPLAPGMIISNEPGYYKEGEYGIRIESLVAVREKEGLSGERPYYEFETITMAPIDRRLIDADMLTRDEQQWLDQYHQQVYETLSPHLEGKELVWLEAQTRPLADKAQSKSASRDVRGRHTEAVVRTQPVAAGIAK